MRVVVTGATGHVGSNLVRALVRRGDQVRVVVRERVRSLEGLDVERVTGDVHERNSEIQETARHVDDMAFLHGCHTETNNHSPALFQINTGMSRMGIAYHRAMPFLRSIADVRNQAAVRIVASALSKRSVFGRRQR